MAAKKPINLNFTKKPTKKNMNNLEISKYKP